MERLVILLLKKRKYDIEIKLLFSLLGFFKHHCVHVLLTVFAPEVNRMTSNRLSFVHEHFFHTYRTPCIYPAYGYLKESQFVKNTPLSSISRTDDNGVFVSFYSALVKL